MATSLSGKLKLSAAPTAVAACSFLLHNVIFAATRALSNIVVLVLTPRFRSLVAFLGCLFAIEPHIRFHPSGFSGLDFQVAFLLVAARSLKLGINVYIVFPVAFFGSSVF